MAFESWKLLVVAFSKYCLACLWNFRWHIWIEAARPAHWGLGEFWWFYIISIYFGLRGLGQSMDACEARSSTAATKNSPLQQTCDSRRLVMHYDPVFFCFFGILLKLNVASIYPFACLSRLPPAVVLEPWYLRNPAKHLTVGSFSARTKWNNGITFVRARIHGCSRLDCITIRLHFFKTFSSSNRCSRCSWSAVYIFALCLSPFVLHVSNTWISLWVASDFLVWLFSSLGIDAYSIFMYSFRGKVFFSQSLPWICAQCLHVTLTLLMFCWRCRANRGGASLGFRRGTQGQALMTWIFESSSLRVLYGSFLMFSSFFQCFFVRLFGLSWFLRFCFQH